MDPPAHDRGHVLPADRGAVLAHERLDGGGLREGQRIVDGDVEAQLGRVVADDEHRHRHEVLSRLDAIEPDQRQLLLHR